jgi:putative transposase
VTVQGFRVELAPEPDQAVRMGEHAGLSRVVENFCLERIKAALAQREAEKTYGIPESDLTEIPWTAPALERAWRAEHPTRYPWFTEKGLSSRVPKEACRMRAAGLKNWAASRTGRRRGRKVGFPTWRKRKNGGRFRYDSDRAKPVGRLAVHLPGVGKVATREDTGWLAGRLATGGRIPGATVREHAGRWWVSFHVDVDRTDVDERRRAPDDAPACGVDLGLKTFATVVDDDGTVTELHAPKPLTASLRRLRRANRRLSRTRPDSANRAKARSRVARVHLDVANRRADFLHKTTTRLARTKSAVAVETLNVAGMARNRRLARAVSDAGWGEFIRQLDYKAGWYGSRTWKADRWFPSSKTCGCCGRVHRGLVLADRVWTCPSCGTVHDRDANAAGNLLAAMLDRSLAGKFPGEAKRLAEAG